MVTKAHIAGGLLAASLAMAVHARSVTSLGITEVGKSKESRQAAALSCRSFRPSLPQMMDYFRRAEPIPTPTYVSQYYSPCYARGTVTFSDGHAGQWTLMSSGALSLIWNEGGSVYLLARPNPWRDPFGGSYHPKEVGL